MARQYVRVRGVGGGRAGTRKPTAPRLVVRKTTNGKRKA